MAILTEAQGFAYIASYSDLTATYGINVAAGILHYERTGRAEGRQITFDALSYVASYGDLIKAVGTDPILGAKHFIQYGSKEGRVSSFDALSYIASYDDLTAAYGADKTAGARHYITAGQAEGRHVSFDALAYVASYRDLIATFGSDKEAAARHFIQTGKAEGRHASFDGLAYIASYTDLISAYGTDTDAGVRHYIKAGVAEGRQATFDGVAYLLSQSDLIAAEYSVSQAIEHWIIAGRSEGRSATGTFGTEQVDHTIGYVSEISGAFDQAGDRDWFKVDLTAGRAITFGFQSAARSGVMTVLDEHGRLLLTVTKTTTFIPPSDGQYFVVVSAAPADTGAYHLTTSNLTPLIGTSGNDTLTGTDGADVLRGLEGTDTLRGRGGNDVLEGGSGSDNLNGGLGDDVLYGNDADNAGNDYYSFDELYDDQGGNDRLYGQEGTDYLSISRSGSMAASTVVLDGGSGGDSIRFNASDRFLDTVTVAGGAEDDDILVGSVLKSTIDGGEGNDKIAIGMLGGNQTITLGAGSDVLTLNGSLYSFAVGNPTRITDFAVGIDTLSMDQYLANTLQNWDKASNPFGTGHLKLVQSGTDTLLQLDRDGASGTGYSASTLLTLADTTASSFTAKDLGFAPVVGSSAFLTDDSQPVKSGSSAFSDELLGHHLAIIA